jgi:cytochrome c peroxidase
MTRATALSLTLAAWLCCAGPWAPAASAQIVLTADEVALAREFSPLPDPPDDPTNAVYTNPAAARLGQALFFDTRLSSNGEISCATCHDPDKGWGDGRRRAKGLGHRPRHSPTLWNVAYNRWFYWDGRKDTLWSQALAPLEDPKEHGLTRLEVVHLIAGDPVYAKAYAEVFGAEVFGTRLDWSDTGRFPAAGMPMERDTRNPLHRAWTSMSSDDRRVVNRAFSNVGKALAAYQRLIVSRRAPFDVFVEGLTDGDPAKLAAIPEAAQRGFSLFTGKAACHICHDGPNFTDLEFHTNRVATGEGVDPGRALGIIRLKADPFNSASEFADDDGRTGARKLSLAKRGWHIPGEFKTPTLRNVAVTAPYMHEGQLQTLEEVVRFYSTLEGAAPPDPEGETLITAVGLTDAEQADLIEFLNSLTDERLPAGSREPPASPRLDSTSR